MSRQRLRCEVLVGLSCADSIAVHAGLVPPAAAVFILGHSGAILMVTMLFMAVTSAGSAELVAVSSLFTYDLYKTYINKNANGALCHQPSLGTSSLIVAPEHSGGIEYD